ncbi:hypothetical protein JCM3770_000582 [Rhodotorula araucariae]
MENDPMAIPGPLQLGQKAPPTHAARIFHPRAVSSPNPTPYSPDPGSHPLDLPAPRRSSLSSSPNASPFASGGGGGGAKNGGHARSKSSTLPSIRSLKSRFQSISFSNTFGRKSTKAVKGEEIKRTAANSVRISGPAAGGQGLKGFSGPAGAADTEGAIGRSASLPAKLHAARQQGSAPSLPQLVFSASNVDEFGVRQSVDQVLAQELRSPVSTYTPSEPASVRSPRQRVDTTSPARPSNFHGRPIVIAPMQPPSPPSSPSLHSTTAPTPSHNQQTSASPADPPYRQPAPPTSDPPALASPTTATAAPIPQRSLSPTPNVSRRILNRVSQDFAREPDAPPLSSLRRQQAAERESMTRSLSRQGHRNSRILPGATLPSVLADMALVRSKSVGADADDGPDPRMRHLSAQLVRPQSSLAQASLLLGSNPLAACTSWQPNGVASEAGQHVPGLLQRRHSVSPVVTPQIPQQADDSAHTGLSGESPPLAAGARQEHREHSHSALLGRTSAGLGFGSLMLGAYGSQRPSEPFPSDFDEVPMQRVLVHHRSVEDCASSPSCHDELAPHPAQDSRGNVSLPFALGDVPHDNPNYPATTSTSARRSSSIRSDHASPALIPFPRADERPPTLYNPFLPSTQLQKARSSSSLSSGPHPRRVSSLSHLLPQQRDADAVSEHDDVRARGHAEAHMRSDEARAQVDGETVAAEERGEETNPDEDGAETSRAKGEDDRGRRASYGLHSPDGRTVADVVDGSAPDGSLDSPLQELIDELRARQPAEAHSHEADDDALSMNEEEYDDFADSPVAGRQQAQGRSLRDISFDGSPGGEYPFPLAGYLDNSPGTSASVGRTSWRPSFAPPTLSAPASALGRSRSSPANPYAAAQHGSPTALRSRSLHSPPASGHGASENSLTLEEMKREIVRMEAELARVGQPQSPDQRDVAGDDASATPARAPTPVNGERDEQRAPSPSPAPISPAAVPPADLVTPRTARKWSILEIEKAYERMRRLLGSSRGPAALDAASEAGSLADDSASLAHIDVETALDSALEQARGFTDRGVDGGDEDALKVLHSADNDETLKLPPPFEFSFDSASPRRPSDASFDSGHFDDKPLPGLPPAIPSPISERTEHEIEPHPALPVSAPHDGGQPVVETPGIELPGRVDVRGEHEEGPRVEEVVDEPARWKAEPEKQHGNARQAALASLPPAAPRSVEPASDTHDPELAVVPSDTKGDATEETGREDDGQAGDQDQAGGRGSETSPAKPAVLSAAGGDVSDGVTIESNTAPTSPTSPILDTVGPSHKYSSVDEALAGSLDNAPPAKRSGTTELQPFASSSGHKRKDSDASSASGMRRLVLPSANRLRTKGTRDSMLSLVSIDDVLADGDGNEPAEPGRNGFTTPPTSPMRRTLQWARSSPSRLSMGGPLRSGVGRELQRRAGADDAVGEGDAQDAERGLLGASTRSRRISIHRLVDPTSPGQPGARRRSIVRAGESDASSWYPQTPSRGTSRVFRAEEPFDVLGKDGDLAPEETSPRTDRSANIANIRTMDKLEIFFRYTAAKADMEKAELERDALIDALRETRTTLADIRRQRDSLSAELKRERQFVEQVKKHLGGDPDRHADRLDALVEGRQTWERRAEEALDALARTQEELERLRAAVQDGRARETLLERENVTISARLAARSEMALEDERTWAPQLAQIPGGGATPRSPPPAHAGGFAASFASTAAPSSYGTALGGSPTLTMSRSASSATARPGAQRPNRSEADGGDDECAALAALPAFSIERGPKDSLGSTASTSSSSLDPVGGFLPFGLGDAGSPIFAQTLRFVPSAADDTATAKSSYESSIAAPASPTRTGAGHGAVASPSAPGWAGWADLEAAPLEFVASESGFTTFRVPFANATTSASTRASSRVSSPALSNHAPPLRAAASKHSHAAAGAALPAALEDDEDEDEGEGRVAAEEGGDASFESVSSYDAPPSANLRERDEAFLRDLTDQIDEFGQPPKRTLEDDEKSGGRGAEDRRGRKSGGMR